jgi:hypothetical protein
MLCSSLVQSNQSAGLSKERAEGGRERGLREVVTGHKGKAKTSVGASTCPLVRLPPRFSPSKKKQLITSKKQAKTNQESSSHAQWMEERALQWQEARNLVMVYS